MITRIAHSTDFSPEGMAAFEHALALAVAHRARLDLLHVHALDVAKDFNRFPHVRPLLEKWGRVPPGLSPDEVTEHTGIQVTKVEIRDVDPVEGLTRYLGDHRPDLIVMSSHARGTVSRWLKGSISTEVLHDTRVPALLVGPHARGFVDAANGSLALDRVLVPVDHKPSATHALTVARALLGDRATLYDLIHLGEHAPTIGLEMAAKHHVRLVKGDSIERIIAEAASSNMVVMATEGRKGLVDRLRGSTTDRVLHEAACPVLAVPERGPSR